MRTLAAVVSLRHIDSPMDRGALRRGRAQRGLIAFVALTVLATLLGLGVDAARYGGRVYRGVRIGRLNVGGMTTAQVRDTLTRHAEALAAESVEVELGEKRLTAKLGELGFHLDVERSIAEAMSARRGGGAGRIFAWLRSFTEEFDIAPVAGFDPERLGEAMTRWNDEFVTRPFEGAVAIKDGEAIGEPPRLGYVVDREATMMKAASSASSFAEDEPGFEKRLEVALLAHHPRRSDASVASALAVSRELVAGPISLYVDRNELAPSEPTKRGRGSRGRSPTKREVAEERITVTFAKEQLVEAFRTRLVEEPLGIEPYFEPSVLDPMMGDLRKIVERPPVEPRFDIEPLERPTVVPGTLGRTIRADAVATALAIAARQPERVSKLPVEAGPRPERKTSELEALRITKLVAKFTTSHPCCMPRVDNIHRIADLVDGTIVKPGETFSVNALVGERTLEKGFKAAPTIVYGEMKDTIGGGISQFATTLFNAAFYGGYDIVERKPHSFYISRYPMGHEATLSYPKPDLVIRNDTDAGLLIRCSYTRRSITVKLYGDNGGRRVRRKVHPVHDVVKAPIEYIADDSLEPGKVKVKERGQVGWSVTVSRLLDFPDGQRRTEERKVVYQPRVRRVRVHPCKIPADDKAYTGEACPQTDIEAPEASDAIEAAADVPLDGVSAPDAPIEDEG